MKIWEIFCEDIKFHITVIMDLKILNELFSRDIIIYFWERYKKESDSKIYDRIEKIYQNIKDSK